MDDKQIQEFMKFLQQFCNENMGNRMNQWLAKVLLDESYIKLEKSKQVILPENVKKG